MERRRHGPAGAAAGQVDINAGDLPPDAPDGAGGVVGFVSCPESLVSKLIGKKGAVIQNLESTTGAKIQVEHQKPGDPKHVRIVAKSQEELDATKKDDPGYPRVRSSARRAHKGDLRARTRWWVASSARPGRPSCLCSRRRKRRSSLIRMRSAFPAGADRDVRIIGMPQSVDRAEKMVTELMTAEPGISAQSVIQKVCVARMALDPACCAWCGQTCARTIACGLLVFLPLAEIAAIASFQAFSPFQVSSLSLRTPSACTHLASSKQQAATV